MKYLYSGLPTAAIVVTLVAAVWFWRTDAARTPAHPGIRPGSTVPDLAAHKVDGNEVVVEFTNPTPTVLYVISPGCDWCERNHRNIVALWNAVSSQYRFIGISDSEHDRDSLESYLQNYPLPFDVLVLDSSRAGLDLSITPQTVVVESGGIVMHSWPGALFGRALSYAEYVFGVRLPGLEDSVSSVAGDEPDETMLCHSDDGPFSDGAVAEVEGVLSRCRSGRWVPLEQR